MVANPFYLLNIPRLKRTSFAQTARDAKNGPQAFCCSRKKQNGECWQFAVV
jgi:hypothetical protein